MANHRPTYSVYHGMLSRCTNPKNKSFPYYGGKGILVCEQWRASFAAFVADMGQRPDGMTLDRKDSNANYSPENCRWVTLDEQNRNRSSVIHITHNGITDTMTGWARRLSTSPAALHYRIRTLGISPDVAVSMPVPSRKTRHSVEWAQLTQIK